MKEFRGEDEDPHLRPEEIETVLMGTGSLPIKRYKVLPVSLAGAI
jgi:hypothetical protein